MRVLIACEESQAVTIEARKLGHEAYSCDIIDCSGGHPEWHIKQDVLPLLNGRCSFETCDGIQHEVDGRWDMIIAFPPCTHLAVSGARWFAEKRADGRQRSAIEFFCAIMNADCDRVAVENPVGIMSGAYIGVHYPDLVEKYSLPYKPVQIIQPWQFGHAARKATCLFGHGFEPLKPTCVVGIGEIKPGGFSVGAALDCARDENGKIIVWNDPRTALIRSKTFHGVAKAMVGQWLGKNES